ncbi:MAG TPA: energy transducer TonB [Cellvibrionaceae bacterium]
MDTSILMQLFDTAFKVGTGAAIAVLTGWFVLKRQNTVGGPRNLREQKRLSIYEDISAFVGQVTHIFSKYASLAAESAQLGEHWPAARRQELEQVNKVLVDTFEKMAAAEAKLLILGEKNLARSLKIYAGQIVAFRRQVYVGRKDISQEQIGALRQGVLQAREGFYDMLSRKYDQVLLGA